MPNNTVLQGNTLNNAPGGGAAEHPSQEAKLREALELMGGRRGASPQVAATRTNAGSASTRHRYVRDGEVPVVRAALGRPRPDSANQTDKALLDSLRQDLERERAAREIAERMTAELRVTSTALQTRLAHLEMDLQAAQEALQHAQEAAEEAAAKLAAGVAAAQSPAPAREPTPPKPRPGRPRGQSAAAPVKWWIKSEKV
ncbi:hypothetical protein [Lichenicoccus sp.]|uniref:hypothetical protein n=1 Tax=Lichenicoccus sp. TaxID=2781899 RepID=UPI003D149B80